VQDRSLRRLVLVRHAKSDYPPGVPDHDRPLNARGRRDAPFIGSWIRDHVEWPEQTEALVLVSTALRAQLTWQRAGNGLNERWRTAPRRDEPRIYEASTRVLLGVIAEVPDVVRTLVLVGHNPGMLDVVATLGIDSPSYREATVKFPTSAVAVLAGSQGWSSAADGRASFTVEAFTVPRA